ncbi:MAG TPA: lipid II flippase MurJ, partial [bacterium]|nr:lipid II flippase MurJ [bacterium]
IMGFSIVQLNLLVDTACAYFIGPGANSALWYGTRLMQFPLGVFGIAMGTALLPMIANQVARKEMEAAKHTLSFALRAVALILFPCAVGLMVLRVPIVQLLFERGHFDAISTARTASVLFYYSIGLFAYSGEKIVAAGFFAIQDTRTPVIMGIVSLVINAILNVILMPFMKESGLALATSIASIAEFIFLMVIYNRRISPLPLTRITRSVVKILAASAAMGIFCIFVFREFSVFFPGSGARAMLIRVFGSISISALAYGGFCLLFRVSEIREAWEWMLKRRKTIPAVKPA